jgi:hypothetical protein
MTQEVKMSKNMEIFHYTDGSEALYSYRTWIATKDKDGKVTLSRKYWNYSPTTCRHRNKFLGEFIAETRRKIKEGIYELI